jgi:DNA oxidative demethylase
VSLGLQAVFLFGGPRRDSETRAVPLAHGDVAVWGGVSRLWFHGVRQLKDGEHTVLGRQRINITFRQALR